MDFAESEILMKLIKILFFYFYLFLTEQKKTLLAVEKLNIE